MQKVQTSLRIDEVKFIKAKEILADLGINFTEAVNIFTSMIVAKQGLPFEVKLPNKKTKQAINDITTNKNIKEVTLNELKVEMGFDEKT
ncbi:MAG: type II toxin-antitoxin system RelB/DinJ family antitoxin [gamma proteobacterium symbiont of Taylorina sp.]|nr:type II toxin-antitoxin system RelB/DinJ family antitoxin [gamma proteobacterium symbiont of Taylorina sp.]